MSSVEDGRHEPGDGSENTVGDSTLLSLTGQDQNAVDCFIDRRWDTDFVPSDQTQDFSELVGQVQGEETWHVGNGAGKVNDSSGKSSGEVS